MIAHIVLLHPRGDLTNQQRADALEAIERAARAVPGVRRFRFGRRVRHGLPGYEQMMTQDFAFALLIEVDDLHALEEYLRAPAHAALGELFSTATSAALAYDYDLTDLAS